MCDHLSLISNHKEKIPKSEVPVKSTIQSFEYRKQPPQESMKVVAQGKLTIKICYNVFYSMFNVSAVKFKINAYFLRQNSGVIYHL